MAINANEWPVALRKCKQIKVIEWFAMFLIEFFVFILAICSGFETEADIQFAK